MYMGVYEYGCDMQMYIMICKSLAKLIWRRAWICICINIPVRLKSRYPKIHQSIITNPIQLACSEVYFPFSDTTI